MRQLFISILTNDYLKKVQETEEYIKLSVDAKEDFLKKFKFLVTKKIENPDDVLKKAEEDWKKSVKENKSLQRFSNVMSYRDAEISSFAKRTNHLVNEVDIERKKINEIAFIFDVIYCAIDNEKSKRVFLRKMEEKENLKEYAVKTKEMIIERKMEEYRYEEMYSKW